MDERNDSKPKPKSLDDFLRKASKELYSHPGIGFSLQLLDAPYEPDAFKTIIEFLSNGLEDPILKVVMRASDERVISLNDPLFGTKQKLLFVSRIMDTFTMARSANVSPDMAARMLLLLTEKFIADCYHDSIVPKSTETTIQLNQPAGGSEGNDLH